MFTLAYQAFKRLMYFNRFHLLNTCRVQLNVFAFSLGAVALNNFQNIVVDINAIGRVVP